MNKRNLGIFRLSAKFIENNPEEVATILSLLRIVPLKSEYRPDWDGFEYLAMGQCFAEMPTAGAAPEYDLLITKAANGSIKSVEAKKI